MKRLLLAALTAILCTPLATAQLQEEPEIVIEMHGTKAVPIKTVSIWNKNALQLTRLFRGKDRTHVLYSVENVSTKDDILRAKNGKEYSFVRYGTDSGNYRKFLFKAEEPQTFVACAATLQDVLAVNFKYGVNMGVSLKDFLRVYGQTAKASTLEDKTPGKMLTVYQQTYSDINHKTPTPYYFVFNGDELTDVFTSEKVFNAYAQKIKTAGEKQASPSQQTKTSQQEQPKRKRPRRTIKALAYGGTVEDQMYMPRVNNPKFPPPTPSKIPAGTPMPVSTF